MSRDLGKKFENQFKKDWLATFPKSFAMRLPDQQSGYYGTSQNVCDFIAFTNRTLFFVECKSHAGASIPFSEIPQYERLITYANAECPGLRCGVVIWLYEKDLVFYMPVVTMRKMIEDGQKSVGVRSFKEGYDLLELPSTKIRVMMHTDYTPMLDLVDGQ